MGTGTYRNDTSSGKKRKRLGGQGDFYGAVQWLHYDEGMQIAIKLTAGELADILEALNNREHSAEELADALELKGDDRKARSLRNRAARLRGLCHELAKKEPAYRPGVTV